MKVISFCLYGNHPMYYKGLLENIKLARVLYSEWEVWAYCSDDVTLHNVETISKNANRVIVGGSGDHSFSRMRFLPISDSQVDVMIVRDSDSRLSQREVDCVNIWLASDKMFHVIRDHPYHQSIIMAGTWGVRAPLLRNINELMLDFGWSPNKGIDEEFLRVKVYPEIAHTILYHDAFYGEFPIKRIGDDFVGSIYDENNNRVYEHHHKMIRESGR